MQSLFDLSMPAPLSYLVAILVVLGLLAIFAIIVRRVAAHGPNPEGSNRGRGPRLGLVDTFSLDKDRQLVIVRRDNVEHLLMIGGTNDVVVETNIVRALSAQSVRETPFLNAAPDPAPLAVEPPSALQPVQPLPPSAPRLRPTQPNLQPQVPTPARIPLDQDGGMSPQSQHPVAYQAHDDFGPDQQRETVSDDAIGYPAGSSAPRQSFNQSELMALAKRLEASIPATGVPKAEKATPAPVPAPVPAPAQIQMPPVSLSAPIAPPAPAAEPAPQPVSVSLKPQPAPQGNYAPEMNMVPVASPPQLRPSAPRPTMAPPIRPSVQPPVAAPVMPQEQSAIAENYSEPHPIPMPEPVPVPPPVQTREAAPAPDAPKDRQAAALDENLRRLLGRKIEPRQ